MSEPGTLSADRAPQPAWLGRIVDLVVGTHPSLRSRVSYGLHPILIYLAWCAIHAYSAHAGYMSMAGATFMIAHNFVGMIAFYPLVRSGYSARFQDSGLVQPQIMWAASSTIICYALNPALRPALMQMLCFIHLFGLFTLRPRQLVYSAIATISMLFIMLGVMASLKAAQFDAGEELFKVAFAAVIITLLTWMSILHARVRGRLSTQKKELAIAVAKLNELVTCDSLTGLCNRMHMQTLLRQEATRQARTGKNFCIALIDLDHFKAINDQYGHQVGDEVLCSFARDAGLALRETDIIARWGGEEFLVLMRETARAVDASLAIDRLRASTDASAPSAAVPDLRFSFSAGIAMCSEGQSVEQLVERADQALYAAKRAGRHCTVSASV
jgi:diguanylate cyclase (GGDEF)-like protein